MVYILVETAKLTCEQLLFKSFDIHCQKKQRFSSLFVQIAAHLPAYHGYFSAWYILLPASMILHHLQFVSTLGPMKLHVFLLVMRGAWSIEWLFVCTYSNMCAQCKCISSTAPTTVHTDPNYRLVLTQWCNLYRNNPSTHSN